MKDGFISVACGAPKLRLADCVFNAEQTFQMMRSAEQAGVKVLVLPELGLTGYTCGDLWECLCGFMAGCITARLSYKEDVSWAWFPRPICPITANSMKSAGLPRLPRRRTGLTCADN